MNKSRITQTLTLILTVALLMWAGCKKKEPAAKSESSSEPVVSEAKSSQPYLESTSKKMPLTILYVGMADSERLKGFKELLETYFQTVKTADLTAFKEEQAHDADVVIFDKDGVEWKPLPIRVSSEWSKPTISMGVPGAFWCGRTLNLKLGYM